LTRAFIGLGSNVGDREGAIRAALDRLAAGLDVLQVSTLRETDPVGYLDQPKFLNGVAEVDTELRPRELLERLLEVERQLGRDRNAAPPQGPRTIDLDLLLYGDEIVDTAGLRVPHERLHERRFVLEPLAEIAPGIVVPGLASVETMLAELPSSP
jgi:2-amino-4-hydroxy-6-hydroxymethyldihydropteridine diphosphokinase